MRLPTLNLTTLVPALLLLATATSADAASRPNILWISCEDISSHLGCYGDPNATTPTLDALAEEGVRYTHAFTCHGVCAPSRTGIITGMYPNGLGANHMRSDAAIPEHIKGFPTYLRKAGYYCTNSSKEDYNFGRSDKSVLDGMWDDSSRKAHWKNRDSDDQPFFAVFNLTVCHESKIWPENWKKVTKDLPKELFHDPNKIDVPKLYPDAQNVKEAHARLLDIITVMDRQVATYLEELEDAGLADDTIVIFWSDHGDGFPRAKRWIYDSGTRVPMIARIPEKFRVDGQGIPGSTDDRMINLIDLGPTVLNLAGVTVPLHMFGRPFLGNDLGAPHEHIFGARDRVDERFDLVRSARSRQFRYVRNDNAWRPALQYIQYAEKSVVRQEMRRRDAAGTLQPESAQFLHAPRAAEELYDLDADPWELHNLADDPNHQDTLRSLRKACYEWRVAVHDAHLIPESMLEAESQEVGNRWSVLHREGGLARVERLLKVAAMASTPTVSDLASLREAASSPDAAERWWAAQGLANLTASDEPTMKVLQALADDPSPGVRVAAGRALVRAGKRNEGFALLSAGLNDDSEFVRHAALAEIDELPEIPQAVRKLVEPLKDSKGYIGNLANHVLRP